MKYEDNRTVKTVKMPVVKSKPYRILPIFIAAVILFTYIGNIMSLKADVMPGLKYNSKVIYIGSDRLNKYSDSCWTPSINVTGWTVKYQIVEKKEIISIENNGRITATGAGIGAAKVKVTYSKKGMKDVTAYFTVKVRRNASHVKLTNQSVEALGEHLIVGESITFHAAKSYDGTYKKGHYGLNNYIGVISDSLRIEAVTPDIIETDGLTVTAKAVGTGKFIVKAYQYIENKFTGIQSKVYTIKVIEEEVPEPTILPIQSEMDILFSERTVELTNKEREKEGLSSLIYDAALTQAALGRAEEIVQLFSHTRPDEKEFYSIFEEFGITFMGVGENIASGQKTPEEVVEAWMNSEGHRKNILNENFTTIGIGVYTFEERIYWVQLFMY